MAFCHHFCVSSLKTPPIFELRLSSYPSNHRRLFATTPALIAKTNAGVDKLCSVRGEGRGGNCERCFPARLRPPPQAGTQGREVGWWVCLEFWHGCSVPFFFVGDPAVFCKDPTDVCFHISFWFSAYVCLCLSHVMNHKHANLCAVAVTMDVQHYCSCKGWTSSRWIFFFVFGRK